MAQILLVEDDPDVREVAEVVLTEAGHGVTISADGEIALKLLREHTFDMILMNVSLPGLDGITLTRILRSDARYARYHTTPILGFTARAFPHEVAKMKAAGMDDVLTKPHSFEALYQAVDALLAEKPPPTQA